MTGPFFALLPLVGAIIGVCWILSVVTREYSWVDRIWSIAPPLYLWLQCWQAGPAPRLVLMAVLATAWGLRLTFNFARKGGYRRGGEDYRWAVLRERLGPVKFQLFNATFIAPYQNLLIWALTFPGNDVASSLRPLGAEDAILTVLFLAFLGLETVADEQQWRFHRQKAVRKARGEAGPEFCTTGLFRYSRHPNFVGELAQWWVMYGFAVVATGRPLLPSVVGAVLLTVLFDGSTRFTERISASKYPAYAAYQRSTSRLLPWFPARQAAGR